MCPNQLHDLGLRLLRGARLPDPIHDTCLAALRRPGRLFSANAVWSRLFLAWIETLTGAQDAAFQPAAVACECMAAGYDLVDAMHDDESEKGYALSAGERMALARPRAGPGTGETPAPPETRHPSPRWPLFTDLGEGSAMVEPLIHALPAGIALLLLAQEVLTRLDLPAERRVRAVAAFARAGRRACRGQLGDDALRAAPTASPDAALAVIRWRSGALAAAPCQAAALLAGAPWRVLALAGRFGGALGCAAQLEDDLADRAEDARGGRKTVPLLLTQLYPTEPDLVEALTWVLVQGFLHDAAEALARLSLLSPAYPRTGALWTFLPSDPRAA